MSTPGEARDPPPGRHDIVVIGASYGGVEALGQLVGGLPEDLPAAICVVLHVHPAAASALPEILTRRGPLRAIHAVHGEAVVPGRIYVAPPDNHLMLRPGYLHVVRGPKENGHRPAVDALFRTASAAYGPRVLGVVLTGYQDCGTAGLLSIKARGGVAVVQDPKDAAAPDMPWNALQHAPVDHVAPLAELPQLITRLVATPAGDWPGHVAREIMELEGDEPGAAADIVCPLCQGKLTESALGSFQMFRCHVGHAFSLESVAAQQADDVERALWAATRALEESAVLSQRLAQRASGDMQRRFEERARTQQHDVEVLRRILLGDHLLSRADAPGVSAAAELERARVERAGQGSGGESDAV